MSARPIVFASIAACAAGTFACASILGDFTSGDALGAGDDAGDRGDGGGSEGGATTDGSVDRGEASPGSDGAVGSDAACAPICSDPSTVKDCTGAAQTCTFECATAGGAHCTVIHPTAPVDTSDLTTAGTTDVTLTASTRFVSDTGAIDNVRPANTDPLKMEVAGGIGFRLARGAAGQTVGVWTFKDVTVNDGVTVRFTQANPVAWVAAGTIAVSGIVDARGYDATGKLCASSVSTDPGPAGPGGGAGGTPGKNGSGPGGGRAANPSTTFSGGPAGGAFGGIGGAGGPGANATTLPAAPAPAAYGTLALSPLVGGSGGGGAYAAGGGGGGAIQLVAGAKVIIGGGAAAGGVNAGGCNGHTGYMGSAGSAAGSGGAILIEAPALELRANGVLAANGGGGATGGGGADPNPGQLSASPAFGTITQGYGYGGQGGAGSTTNGANGTAGTANGAGGAGGGAVGRIRLNNRSGSYTPPSGSIVSPAFDIPATQNPPSSIGVLDIH